MSECPFARNGIREGLKRLTDVDGLLVKTVEEVRRSNELTRESNLLAKSNSRMLRAVVLMFILAVLLLIIVGLLAWRIFDDVTVVEQRIHQTADKVDEMVKAQKKTDDKIDEVKKDQEEQPKVEIVAEPDPEKAKESPLKVRITPGKPPENAGGAPVLSPGVAATQTAVEVPLPVKEATSVKVPKEKEAN